MSAFVLTAAVNPTLPAPSKPPATSPRRPPAPAATGAVGAAAAATAAAAAALLVGVQAASAFDLPSLPSLPSLPPLPSLSSGQADAPRDAPSELSKEEEGKVEDMMARLGRRGKAPPAAERDD